MDLNARAFGREGDVQTVEEAPVPDPLQVGEESGIANSSKTPAVQQGSHQDRFRRLPDEARDDAHRLRLLRWQSARHVIAQFSPAVVRAPVAFSALPWRLCALRCRFVGRRPGSL